MSPTLLLLDQEGIGPRIAEARKLRGLTQQGLAMRVPCSKSLVSQVEQGSKPASPSFIAGVARALSTDVTELTGQPYRGTTERTDRVHAAIPHIRLAMSSWDVPPDLDVAPRSLSAIRNDIWVIGQLLDNMDYVKLGKWLPGLIEELSFIWHESAETDRKEVARLLMHTHIAVKAIAYRLGYVDLVSLAIDRASLTARATDDPQLLAFVKEERCQTFFVSAAHNAGLKFIERTRHDFGSLIYESESGLAILGSLHLRASIMAARTGRTSDTWDQLGHAREIAERIGRETNHFGLIFGPANVKIHEIAAAVERSDPDEALRCNEGFIPPQSLPSERSSHHYIDLARAHFVVGHNDKALSSILKAERLAPQHTRNHPMARETTTGLLKAHSRTIPETLRALARRMRISSETTVR